MCWLLAVGFICGVDNRMNYAFSGEAPFYASGPDTQESLMAPLNELSGSVLADASPLGDGRRSGSSFLGNPFREDEQVEVPEPLLFDLVRPLGARKGEVEFNTLAIFPWKASRSGPSDDDIPTNLEGKSIKWAPEVEYAIADNFAIEFEFPFEEDTLAEYKLGLQWTIGTAFDNRYIHGFQMLVQPDADWRNWNTTLLYLGGIRFDETWSALVMIGGRMDLEGPNNWETVERLFNASLFADINDSVRIGLETNYASGVEGESEFVLIPQVHYQMTECIQVQSGLGFSASGEGSEQSFIMRAVFSK